MLKMKLKIFILALVIFSISCSNDKKSTATQKQIASIKSNILLESSAYQAFSNPDRKDFVYLTISGETILESTATLKALNKNGEEIHCVTFSSKDLIQREYRTADSTLKEAHIREVVDGFFVRNSDESFKSDETYAGL